MTLEHDARRRLFSAAKYATYSLLLLNVFLFMREELGALQHTFTSGMSVAQFVQVFAATIDTTAWVLLLFLLELETSVLEDEQIQGWTRRSLHGIRLICAVAIVWAFLGYCAELGTLYQATLMPGWSGCNSLSDGWSLLIRQDEYSPLDKTNCGVVAETAFRIADFRIVADAETLHRTRYLAWVDVINAATWILVVIVLEVEVRLQLRGRLTDSIVGGTRYLKYILYSTLFVAAVYWGFEGKFLDFWDASLWLFAFVFIELNVFDWQQETQGQP